MFTGIVTDRGEVRAVGGGADRRIDIATSYDPTTIALGASICCSGVCLTVIEVGSDGFAVSASAETLARTTVGGWQPGTTINLERSLKLGDELGGHLVFGHVDAVATVSAATAEGESRRLVFSLPDDLERFVAVKGSVAIDGVSLTVNAVRGPEFTVNLIPHTLAVTSLGEAVPGTSVNFEVDMLARYVARLQDWRA